MGSCKQSKMKWFEKTFIAFCLIYCILLVRQAASKSLNSDHPDKTSEEEETTPTATSIPTEISAEETTPTATSIPTEISAEETTPTATSIPTEISEVLGCRDKGGNEDCSEKKRNCTNKQDKESEYVCGSCIDGYREDPETKLCKEVLGCRDEGGKEDCTDKKRSCTNKLEKKSEYVCGSCIDGYREDTETKLCIEVLGCRDEGGNEDCSDKKRSCTNKLEKKSEYVCGSCIDGYREDSETKLCIVVEILGCRDEGGNEDCSNRKRSCTNKPENKSEYVCGSCIDGYREDTETKLCKEILGCRDEGGNEDCTNKKRSCTNKPENKSEYVCGSCIDGYREDTKTKLCKEILGCRDEGGNEDCTDKKRSCTNKPEKKAEYVCGSCIEGFREDTETKLCIEILGCRDEGGNEECSDRKRSCTNKPEKKSEYVCGACIEGYREDTESKLCKATETSSTTPIDMCLSNPCKNGGNCTMKDGNYECKCIADIYGDNCENCTAKCSDAKCAFKDFFYCKCDGRKWFNTTNKECENIDKCVQDLMEGRCRGKYEICKGGECGCENDYLYNISTGCREKCTCDTVTQDCVHSDNGKATCICKDKHYFTGTKCVKEDTCATRTPKCEQKCNEGTCSCDAQHYDVKDEHRCVLKDNTNPCKNSAKCSPGQCLKEGDVERCICPEKTHYSFKENCTDLCSANKLPPGTCPNDECSPHETYGFICNCTGRFKQSTDGIHCELKQMCSEGGKSKECAKINAQCVEAPDFNEGYACNCEDGYDKDENGFCVHKCQIKKNEENCLKMNAKCILDDKYNNICKCPPLFEEDTNKKKCVKAKHSYTGNFTVPRKTYENPIRRYIRRPKRSINQVDYVALYKDFKKSLKIAFGKDSDFFILGCETHREDFKCEIEMKFKTKPDEKLLDSIADPSLCIPLGNTDYCTIESNLIMKRPSKGVLKLTDPCEESVKNQICGPTTNCRKKGTNNELFDCICKDGYSAISVYPIFEGEESLRDHCEDINECLKATSCPKNSHCFNTPGSYSCFCNNGFRDKSDNVKKDGCIGVCEHKLCGEHGRCQAVGNNGYFCSCTDHYLGQFCNVTNPALKELKKSGITTTAIVGGVLGAVLIIVLIAGFVYFRRNKKFVNNDEEYSKHRERAIYAERARQGIRQQRDGSGNRSNQHSLERRGSGDYRQYRNGESHMIPRVQTGASRPLPDMSDDNRMHTNNDRRPQREHFSDDDRRSHRPKGAEAATHRSLNRSSDHLDDDGRRVSVVQYKNRGYEED
ncbi:fibropellin-1 isoform X3 [Parasteatoda tepidariorum]|uniref:fibropellin-1 isoform X3 n=1 Tax=Parasteatoda tepidariorum TaxID=114398 RepID=UPI0039BC619F